MSIEIKRRNSLERYQPRKSNDDNDELPQSMNNLILDESSPVKPHNTRGGSRNNRRGVNSHLYGGNRGGCGGRGQRGRGRGGGGGGSGSGSGGDNYLNNRRDTENRQHNPSSETSKWSKPENDKITFQSNTSYKPYQGRQRGDIPVDPNSRNASSHKKNTETFRPSHKPADMRILTAHSHWTKYAREITSRDVLIVHGLFCDPSDLTIYNKLLNEIKSSGIDQEDLWKLWHGDSHLIADDKQKWKDVCPTFHMVLNKIQEYFEMDIKATRLNWYRDSSEWKPFHHDAAAIKPDKAKTQNLTVGVSFGAEREAAFEHATTKTVISMPQPNGTIYVFSKDVNVIWRHGILQVHPDNYHEKGRISIIAWGWSDQKQV